MGNKTRSDWHNGWGGGRKDGVRCPVPHAFPFLFPSFPIQPGSLGMLKQNCLHPYPLALQLPYQRYLASALGSSKHLQSYNDYREGKEQHHKYRCIYQNFQPQQSPQATQQSFDMTQVIFSNSPSIHILSLHHFHQITALFTTLTQIPSSLLYSSLFSSFFPGFFRRNLDDRFSLL